MFIFANLTGKNDFFNDFSFGISLIIEKLSIFQMYISYSSVNCLNVHITLVIFSSLRREKNHSFHKCIISGLN